MCKKRFLILLPVLMLFGCLANCSAGGNPSQALGKAMLRFPEYAAYQFLTKVVVPACVITGGIFAAGCLAGYLAGRCKGNGKDEEETKKSLFCTFFAHTLGVVGKGSTSC